MLIQAGCHCGNIRFTFDWKPEPKEIPARACDCTFCTKHGGVWTSNPNGVLRVRVEDESKLNRYEFGTKTAVFNVCARCGAVPVVTSDIEGHRYAVVNVNTFENVPAGMLKRAPMSFEGENLDTRLARRTRSWIRDVEFR